MAQPLEAAPGRKNDIPAFVPELLSERESGEQPLAGKVGVVTGIRDISGSIALALAINGAQVVSIHRDARKEKRTKPITDAIQSCSPSSISLVGDITQQEDRARLAETVQQSGKKLDFIVLSASGATDNINTANDALVSELLPLMAEEGKIFFLQSTPSHYHDQIESADMMPELYQDISRNKQKGAKSLRARRPEYNEKNISIITVCAPLVPDTWNATTFSTVDKSFEHKNNALSDALGIPRSVSTANVGRKLAELAAQKNIPSGHIELFADGVHDVPWLLEGHYVEEDVLVDTLDVNKGIGRLLVTSYRCPDGEFLIPQMTTAVQQTIDALAIYQDQTLEVETIELPTQIPIVGDAVQIQIQDIHETESGRKANVIIMNRGKLYTPKAA